VAQIHKAASCSMLVATVTTTTTIIIIIIIIVVVVVTIFFNQGLSLGQGTLNFYKIIHVVQVVFFFLSSI
jgi:hypothetical protein